MNISILEFLVYGFFAYSSVAVLIWSIRDQPPPRTRQMTLIKSAYMLPGAICCLLLAGSGVFIFLDSGSTEIITVYNGTDSSLITNSTTTITPASIELQNPVWQPLHYMLAAILMIFVFTQILQMFSARD